jgi:hypothetical protein
MGAPLFLYPLGRRLLYRRLFFLSESQYRRPDTDFIN